MTADIKDDKGAILCERHQMCVTKPMFRTRSSPELGLRPILNVSSGKRFFNISITPIGNERALSVLIHFIGIHK